MGESGGKGWFVMRSHTTDAIKLAMAGVAMVAPISSILGLLILYHIAPNFRGLNFRDLS